MKMRSGLHLLTRVTRQWLAPEWEAQGNSIPVGTDEEVCDSPSVFLGSVARADSQLCTNPSHVGNNAIRVMTTACDVIDL